MKTPRRFVTLCALALVAALLQTTNVAALPADNDDFSKPVVITGPSGSVQGSNTDATFQTGDPAFHAYWEDDWSVLEGDDFFGHSMWYSWTAPSSPSMTRFVASSGDYGDITVGVYTGALGDLTEVAFNLRSSSANDWSNSRVDFLPEAGQEYRVAVGAEFSGVDFTLTWAGSGNPPGNDDRSAAASITEGVPEVGSTVNATYEDGDPEGIGGRSVWYTYSAAHDGVINLSLNGSDYDTTLGVYTEDSGVLTQVAYDDDSGTGTASAIDFSAHAGTKYYFAVGGWGPYAVHGSQVLTWGESGDYTLSLVLGAVVPDQIEGTGFDPSDQALMVRWSVQGDGGSDITYFTVAYRLEQEPPATWTEVRVEEDPSATTNRREYSITGLTNGATYEYKVLAANAVGEGPYSIVRPGVPGRVPDAPVLVATPSVGSSPGSVQVNWTPGYDGGYSIAWYQLEWKETGATSSLSVWPWATDTSWTFGMLTNGVSYDFRILAGNYIGDGAWSNVETVMPTNTAVTITSAGISKGKVVVTFGGSGAPAPTIFECSLDEVTWATCTPPTWSPTIKGKKVGKTVYVRGRASSTSNWFTDSEVVAR